MLKGSLVLRTHSWVAILLLGLGNCRRRVGTRLRQDNGLRLKLLTNLKFSV